MTNEEEHGNVPLLHANIVDYADISVAECVEVPVIVQGHSDKEITEKMNDGVKGYFGVFPEKKDEMLKKRSITIPITF